MTVRRQDRREVLHVVEPPGPDLGVEQPGAHVPDAVLEHRHPAGRERPRHQLAQHRVLRRVEPDDHPGVDRLGDMVSSVVPWFELNVSASLVAASMSWKRDSA